ncbi:MAG: ankyrin repeat domain-containing protein [Candidatus Micrarchaeota archaeon]|nr:ankyrin repeat domain-containing protein [Candidatus Micrarchaeota archaeon]
MAQKSKLKTYSSAQKRKSLLGRVRERISLFFWEYERYRQNHYGTFDSDLLEAADHGYVGAARAMLMKGANINARDKDGNTPLIVAVKEHNVAMCEFLIENGADAFAKNNDGEDALTIASRFSPRKIASLLTERYLERVIGDGSKQFYSNFRECTSGGV